jgi:hypothetical protein
MKGGGSREPQPFTSVDPLFYLSSFQTPFRKSRRANGGFFVLCELYK